ncbi:nucleotidyl transferase [Aquipluma nitroreducens]|uniref:Nucleotidyl transferase n=1 Tax=Aquipluma nitroreducens TaxID=2010828 RepID=A0A5K7SDC2_9BACT|nr:nucleotidyltransferase family protein [Aquipluma nitroreducens]BBE19601.1 nucleotidyl transferase [Aquipluma nitroreducens]
MKALLFAAGLGTRLKEHTQDKPKALVSVAGKPLLQHAIEHLKQFGISDITINVFHFAEQVISFVKENNSFGIDMHISDERDQLLDTGGGLKKAGTFLKGNEPILIYNVDVISNLDLNTLLKYHQEQNALTTLVVRQRETSRYLMFDQNLQLAGWKNFSNGETIISRAESFANAQPLAFSGIHIIQPEFLELITEVGKFPIMDLYLRLAKNQSIKAFVDESDLWMDLGKPEQLLAAEKLFGKK